MNTRPNIVLVHGAWADGSSWSAVIERLQASGYHVTAPQFPMTALADDGARLRQVLCQRSAASAATGLYARRSRASACDANRELLSELRRVERKTRLRAEWTAGGSVERFFDYVPKGTRPAGR